MTQDLDKLADKLADAAEKAGATATDIAVSRSVSLSVSTLNGVLETAERAEGVELDLRVLVGQRQALVSASDVSDETIAEMATRAVAMAKDAPEDDGLGLASPDQLATDTDESALEKCDPAEDPDPERLEALSLAAEAAALGVKGVTQVQSSGASLGRSESVLRLSNGFRAHKQRSGFSLGCVAIAGEGTTMTRDADGDSRVHFADLREAEEIGAEAGERAVAMQGARKPKSGKFPVIYDERVSGSLVMHLLAAINGQAIVRGSSWARDLEGAQIMPADLSLIEEPHRPRLGSSRLFDAEGLPTSSRAIIDHGVLTGWVLDLATARRLGRTSTGNAARGGSGPVPQVGNVTLTTGGMSREALLRDTGDCLLITSLMGATINPNTGDYSRGASGFWVEGGEIAYPVHEFTLAGNLKDMLAGLTPANDARPWVGRRVPSLRVEGLTIAGTD